MKKASPRPPLRWRTPVVLALAALAAVSGCIFDTREPNDPGETPSSWIVPTVPSRVFQNLESGLEERNGTNYIRSLHEAFTFVPHPTDEQALPGKYAGWTADTETQVVNRIVAEASRIEVRFSHTQQITDQSTFAEFRSDYELITVNAVTAEADTFRGFAEYDMVNGSKGWQMSKWDDLETVGGYPTWGRLRGEVRE